MRTRRYGSGQLTGLLGGVLLLVGASAQASLYERLGGEAGVKTIVAHFVYRLANDPEIGALFEGIDFANLDRQLRDQICEVSDGPCVYEGKDMVEAHEGQNITAAEFNRLVEVLQDSMAAAGTPFPVQNQLLARLAPMHGDVVGH